MTFSEKLTFLLDLSGSSNAELARAAKIDPSQVSRLKNGTRNTPKRIHTIELMAEHFAERCTSEYQRATLAETLGDRSLINDRSLPHTVDALCRWLRTKQSDSSTRLDSFMRNFEGYSSPRHTDRYKIHTESNVSEMRSCCHFGNEGRRNALVQIVDYLTNYGTPCEVSIISDENLDWLSQDRNFSEWLISAMVKLTETGYSVRRIVSSLRDSVSAIEALERWMPLYMSGSLTSYHYPRLRDGLYRHFLVVAPGNLALTSCSIGDQHKCSASYISYDQRTIEDEMRFFNAYLEKCIPLAEPYIYDRDPILFSRHLLDFHSIESDGMSKWLGMSCTTVPDSIIDVLETTYKDERSSEILHVFRTIQKTFELNLASGCRFVEIIRPFSAQQVTDGSARLSPSLLLPESSLCYTPELYRDHLLHILELATKYSNYFVVVDDGDMSECEMHVKEGQSALLVRTTPPFTMFNITEPNTVSSVSEYIMLQATRYGSSLVIQRRHAIEKLRALIASLDIK